MGGPRASSNQLLISAPLPGETADKRQDKRPSSRETKAGSVITSGSVLYHWNPGLNRISNVRRNPPDLAPRPPPSTASLDAIDYFISRSFEFTHTKSVSVFSSTSPQILFN